MVWGANPYGALGNGTTIDSRVPVSVSGVARAVPSFSRGNGSLATYAYDGDGVFAS